MKITHHQTNKRIRLFAAFACCLLAGHFAAQTCVGQRIRLPVPTPKSGGKINASTLSKYGPLFPAAYVLGDFSAHVFVREAPMVVEYHLGNESTATLTIKVKVKKEVVTFTQLLERTGDEFTQKRFQLPAQFGKKPLVATLSVKAENIDLTNKKPPDFELTGLCMGEKACGSIGIDLCNFQRDRVHATQKEKVAYSFHSRFDFEKASVEFRFMGYTSTGEPDRHIVNKEKISGIHRGDTVSREWNGKNQEGKISKGPHQFVVKAWNAEKKGADYAAQQSRKPVLID